MKKTIALFTPKKISTTQDDTAILISSISKLKLERSPSAPIISTPDNIAPVKASEAVAWIKNYNPESSATKLPQAVYQKRFQTARIDTTRNKKGIGSGILIAENMLLTARHCVDSQDTKNLKVRFGIHKKGTIGDPPYSVTEVHAPDSPCAKNLGLTCGPLADLVLLELETTNRVAPGTQYGFTPIKAVTEAHAKSGLYLLDYASGSHLKTSAMLTRPVPLSKCLSKSKNLKKLAGKPVFWNGGQQYGKLMSATKIKNDVYLWMHVESDTRSKRGYAEHRFRVSLTDNVVYNQKGQPIKEVFMGRNILFGHDHILVGHKAFPGGSGGVFLTETGEIFAVLCGILDSVHADMAHHIAVRPDIFQTYVQLYQGYMTPETLEQDKKEFEAYRAKASKIFGASISDLTLYIAFTRKIALPKRVGGHDDDRNQVGGNQKGSSQSANEHGINQGNQWKNFQDTVLEGLSPTQKEKHAQNFKALSKSTVETTEKVLQPSNKGQRHSPDQQAAHALEKSKQKTDKKETKRQQWQNKENEHNR